MVESIFAELGETADEDVLVRVHYDGNHRYESDSVLIAFWDSKLEEEAMVWVRKAIKAKDGLAQVASICLTAWQALVENKGFGDLSVPEEPLLKIEGKSVEAALLDRKLTGSVHYRTLDLNRLKG